MKFGKRLSQEASRRWSAYYCDYKALKKAIKDDLQAQDAQGSGFQRVLVAELQKVSSFYLDRSAQLEVSLQQTSASGKLEPGQLAQLRSEVKELIKFVALNYLAVVKAIKKRNKNMKELYGASSGSTVLHALDLLGNEVFFTSPRLANLATQMEVLASETASGAADTQAALEEFQCPICLDTLHNPVVLTCAHRFCWGCLVAYCTTQGAHSAMHLVQGAKAADVEASAKSLSRVLEQIANSSEQQDQQHKYFNCPVCRKPQVLDVDNLAIDAFLANYIQGLKAISNMSVSEQQQQPGAEEASTSAGCSSSTSPAQAAVPEPPTSWGIIPPQSPQHAGKLTVLLDLDGTLVASFTPRRAPRLPSSMRSHVVGVGSKLNPAGVFVVERPGLTEFLRELSSFAEVIIFTAGLEDYAKPIIDAIDPQDEYFAGRIYREGTLRTDYYQCVKDMARLNRDLNRTILVDDTPLAFLHQPDNGVPVLGFRGDPDDRLLMEAVLPLCHVLRDDGDVRLTLQRRFDMCTWFARNSFPIEAIMKQAQEAVTAEKEAALAALRQQSVPASPAHNEHAMACCAHGSCSAHADAHMASSHQQQLTGAARFEHLIGHVARAAAPSKRWLLLTDFDNTLTNFDAGERVCEALAPELLPMLVGIQTPANFIPITNTILSEMQRRGVSRDALVQTLNSLGAEVPSESVDLLRSVQSCGVDTKVLSDCNSVFISHIMSGARAGSYVQEVITNAAAFERVGSNSASGSDSSTPSPSTSPSGPSGLMRGTGHKLVIKPNYGPEQPCPHGCKLCPENLCKGLEVAKIKQANTYERIVFCGDGANDICGALSLGPEDFVLARSGFPLAQYVLESRQPHSGLAQVAAAVEFWSTQEELSALVATCMASASPSASASF